MCHVQNISVPWYMSIKANDRPGHNSEFSLSFNVTIQKCQVNCFWNYLWVRCVWHAHYFLPPHSTIATVANLLKVLFVMHGILLKRAHHQRLQQYQQKLIPCLYKMKKSSLTMRIPEVEIGIANHLFCLYNRRSTH